MPTKKQESVNFLDAWILSYPKLISYGYSMSGSLHTPNPRKKRLTKRCSRLITIFHILIYPMKSLYEMSIISCELRRIWRQESTKECGMIWFGNIMKLPVGKPYEVDETVDGTFSMSNEISSGIQTWIWSSITFINLKAVGWLRSHWSTCSTR